MGYSCKNLKVYEYMSVDNIVNEFSKLKVYMGYSCKN
jgi:hypothetical protein